MKKFISKVKKSCHKFMTGKSGFSLVELIVVIAIMAVMAAVLAPALLGYVERSRAQKDSSAMGEVTNAIQLSLADQDVYDELLPYAVKGNFSCYCDGDTSTNTDANKTITKAPDYWLFTDEARKLDETPYQPAGSMRGATVTFKPNGEAEYILKAGIVNKIGDDSTKKGTNGGAVLEDCPELYNRLRSTVGDTIKVSSQTYRNSTYTIFISMGTTGGNQADKQDAIQVYGQYNGTNLPEVMTATGAGSQDKGNAGGSGTSTPTVNDGKFEYGVNDPDLNPMSIKTDRYTFGNITYKLKWSGNSACASTIDEGKSNIIQQLNIELGMSVKEFCSKNGMTEEEFWTMFGLTEETFEPAICIGIESVKATNNTEKEYGPILESINGIPVTSLYDTFNGCTNLTVAPNIPESVTNMNSTFQNCTALTTVPEIPNKVIALYETFANCTSITDLSDFVIPNSVTNMFATFMDCTSLTTAPEIPSSVNGEMMYTFRRCTSLTGTITINSNTSEYYCCFEGVDFAAQNLSLIGSSTRLAQLGATGTNYQG